MRHKTGAALLILAMLAVLLPGCGRGEPKIRTAVMVDREVAEGEKAEPVEVYPSSQVELLLYGKALYFSEEDRLTIRWVYEEAGEYEIYLDTGKSGRLYEFYSRIDNGGNPWPKGAYRVELYVNDREEPDKTVRFRVE